MAEPRKSRFSEAQQADVMLSLQVSQGNVKRTARETAIPESTVRRWKKKWDAEGIPPALLEVSKTVVGDFTVRAKQLRQSAVDRLAGALDAGEGKPAQLITVIGVLTDKINLAEGFATSRQEHVQQVALPSPEETAKFVEDTYTALEERQATIDGTAREPAVPALAKLKE